MTTSRGSHQLHRGMSVQEFRDGYFYAADLKRFAREVGIVVGNHRKIELEDLIAQFLETGQVPVSKPVYPRKSGEPRDSLTATTPVTNYVGDKVTKAFLLRLVAERDPSLRVKSGQWYWLNDWRREKQRAEASFTYQDLADRLTELMSTEGRLPPIPSARMNNFLTDLRADPVNREMSREEALKEWQWLKGQPGPNTYEQYQRVRPKQQRS